MPVKIDKPYTKEQFIQLFLEHKSNKGVAKHLGWSTSLVSRFKTELGITKEYYPNALLGRPSWNTGLAHSSNCELCDAVIFASKKKNRRFCSVNCFSFWCSEAYSGDKFAGEKNPNYGNDKVKQAWEEGRYDHIKRTGKDNPNYGNGEATRRAWLRGAYINAKQSGLEYTRGKRTEYKGISFKSTWEAEFAKELDEEKLTWSYEPKKFLLSNGKTYLPDFYVYDFDRYYEIKGFWWPKALAKFNLFLDEYPEIEIEVKSTEWWAERQWNLNQCR